MTRDQILAQLLKGPQTVEELQSALGFTYDKTHNSLARLVKAKKVYRFADKRYAHSSQVALVNGQPTLLSKVGTVLPGAKKKLVFGSINNPTVIDPTPAPAAPQGRIVNRYVVLYDSSGSMSVHRERALQTVNKILQDIKEAANQFNQVTEVSLYQFSDTVRQSFYRRPAELVSGGVASYYPAGGTALWDAVGKSVKDHLIPEQPNENVSTVVLVVTDGEENRSGLWSASNLAELIRQVQKTDRWTVTFQVPPGYKRALCQNLGVPEGNVREWEQTDRGFQEAADASRRATMDYMSLRSKGVTKSTSYYVTPDLSGVTQADLNKLTNIAGQVKIWRVEKEQDVESFIESKLGPGSYVRGTAFYELTKPEKVQSYKKVLIAKKNAKNEVYGGNQARSLLGLPSGVDAKVTPGNHSNFDVFNQSTSNNRILVRGSRVAYWPGAVM